MELLVQPEHIGPRCEDSQCRAIGRCLLEPYPIQMGEARPVVRVARVSVLPFGRPHLRLLLRKRRLELLQPRLHLVRNLEPQIRTSLLALLHDQIRELLVQHPQQIGPRRRGSTLDVLLKRLQDHLQVSFRLLTPLREHLLDPLADLARHECCRPMQVAARIQPERLAQHLKLSFLVPASLDVHLGAVP